MRTQQYTKEELAAKRVGALINVVIAIAGAGFCLAGIFMWGQHNLNF